MRHGLLVLLIIALACSTWLNLRHARTIAAKDSLLASRNEQIRELKDELREASNRALSAVEARREAIARLQLKLAAQRKVVDDADRRLRIADNTGLPQDDSPRIQARLDQENTLLSELDLQLRAYRAEEAQLGGRVRATLETQAAGRQEDDQTVAARIASQLQLIQATQARIAALQDSTDAMSHEQRNQLQAQLNGQKSVLQQLKVQRKQASVQWNQSTVESRHAAQGGREQIRAAERQLSAQIAIEKENARALRQQLQAAGKTVQAARASIDGLRAQDQAERQKLQQIQTQLDDERKKLATLVGGA